MMVYQSMLVADRIAALLQREGAEHVVGFPENRLINSAAALGMRPIITRTERVAVNIADGFARATNGERLLPCATQYGPGTEAAFGAVAQAYGDRSPILLVPTEYAVEEQDAGPSFRSEQAYRPITRFAATVNSAAAGSRASPRTPTSSSSSSASTTARSATRCSRVASSSGPAPASACPASHG